eukprot:COSAG02_NODE_29279_length_572_cov_1.162791_2_plen_26_part_01
MVVSWSVGSESNVLYNKYEYTMKSSR